MCLYSYSIFNAIRIKIIVSNETVAEKLKQVW